MKKFSPKVVSALIGVGMCLFGVGDTVNAQLVDLFNATVNADSVVVEFIKSTPCAPYVVDWGDGKQTKVEDTSAACIQVTELETLSHTYNSGGNYTIAVTLDGQTDSLLIPIIEPITVIENERFTLADVQSIIYVWVDPSELIADEEFFEYTITLHNGKTLELEVPGFTSIEYRDEQFLAVGYDGDVRKLLDLATAADKPVIEDEWSEADVRAQLQVLYQELKGLLEAMVVQLQTAITSRTQTSTTKA